MIYDAPASFIQPSFFDGVHRLDRWPFGHLEANAYSLIMIDCAWKFRTWSIAGEEKSPQAKYRTMTLEEIRALPVRDLATDPCMLWMWATAPGLAEHVDILRHWGFKFVTSGAWVKTTKNGKLHFGTGYTLRNSHEIFLIGSIGDPTYEARNVRSVIMEPAREHSRKPDQAYSMARMLIPKGRAADVYSRERRPTWESFGDEAGKFDGS